MTVIAMIVERGSNALVSFGEGKTECEAKANAIYNLPTENESVLESNCEWEIELTDTPPIICILG